MLLLSADAGGLSLDAGAETAARSDFEHVRRCAEVSDAIAVKGVSNPGGRASLCSLSIGRLQTTTELNWVVTTRVTTRAQFHDTRPILDLLRPPSSLSQPRLSHTSSSSPIPSKRQREGSIKNVASSIAQPPSLVAAGPRLRRRRYGSPCLCSTTVSGMILRCSSPLELGDTRSRSWRWKRRRTSSLSKPSSAVYREGRTCECGGVRGSIALAYLVATSEVSSGVHSDSQVGSLT